MAIPIVALAHRLSAPPLVGFLVAGVLVGPNGFALISATEEVEVLSELGVALLLFEVGLELSLSYVRQWARTVLVGGGLQMGGTLLCVAALAIPLGISPGQSIFYGLLAAMSSTAIVSKTTPTGLNGLGTRALRHLDPAVPGPVRAAADSPAAGAGWPGGADMGALARTSHAGL